MVTKLPRRIGPAGLAMVFASGVWLCAAPWVTGQQPRGPWTAATANDVWLGVALTAAGFAGFFIALAGGVRELYGDAERPDTDRRG